MEWKDLFSDNILHGGQEYVDSGAVHNISEQNGLISGDVTGLEEFHVKIRLANNSVEEMSCSCPFAQTGAKCKHMAAVLLSTDIKYDSQGTEKVESEEQVSESENTADINETISTSAVDNEALQENTVTFVQKHDGSITLESDVNTFFSYAVYQNHSALIRTITIKNITESEFDDLYLRIRTDSEMLEPFFEKIDLISAGEERTIKNPKISVNGDYLAALTERLTCNLHISVTKGENELALNSDEIVILAFDQWPGLRYYPDLLAAYVTPNHPAIPGLMNATSKYLEKWTQDPSLEGYQGKDPQRIVKMANAAYAAIQELNITYASLPPSFEDMGQRVRMITDIMDNRLGNCMDITLLYVALLEAMQLNPMMIMIDGHIFSGVWLIDDTFPEPYTDDPTQLEKRMTIGIDELIVVESTAMCAGKNIEFDEAIAIAKEHVSNYKTFDFAIDLVRARRSGVRPLPNRIAGANGYVIEHKNRSESEVTGASKYDVLNFDLDEVVKAPEKVTKQVQWERKLLDLSMRNMLINLRVKGSIIPMLTKELADIEDALAEGAEFEILSRPKEWDIHQIDVATGETINDLGPYEELIELERKHHRLHSWLGEKELAKLLTKMYRSASTSMEENGASTLYMTLGILRWYDGIKVQKEHFAPIVLIPIDIIRKSATQGFVIRERDDEAQVNITLLEFLKQNFNIDITGLNPIPTDDHGIDIEKIFAIVTKAVMNKNMWGVLDDAYIGNFSFSQFVMWNDIHSHAHQLEENKIVHALMTGVVDWDCAISETIDTEDAYLPVPVDASQLRAINMAANDISFVLHGPPGTGKSQTITAMIANALAKEKTVLFVAEKMAALEVVQKRLASLGIGDFCLELHSNKAVKKSVLDQLRKGVELKVWGMSTDYKDKIEEIHKTRAELDEYAKALHTKRSCGMSVRELIDAYEAIPEQQRGFRPDRDVVSKYTGADLESKKLLLERLVTAGKNVGNIKDHVFSNVGQTEYSQSLRKNLEDSLYDYEKAIKLLREAAEKFSSVTDAEMPSEWESWNDLFGFADSIKLGEEIPSFVMGANSLNDELKAPVQYVSIRNQYDQQEKYFHSKYRDSIRGVDFNAYLQRLAEASKKIFGKGKAIGAVMQELQQHALVMLVPEQLSVVAQEVQQFNALEANMNAAKSAIPDHWNSYINADTTIEKLHEIQSVWEKQLETIDKYAAKLSQLKEKGIYAECMNAANQLIEKRNTLANVESKVDSLLALNRTGNTGDWLEQKNALIDLIDEHFSQLRDWITYKGVYAECASNGLEDIARIYASGLDHDAVIPIFFKAVYRTIIWSIIEEEPVLNKFTGNSFNERISQYKKLEEDFIKLTKEEMYYKLTHNLPSSYENTTIAKELAVLRKAISSGGRGMSIRSLFEQIPHVLVRLCPCLLMSPISVAQYLSLDNDKFDVVIFDEASQLPTCKAVGVLARGNNAVVVGDPNQMPPTSFFAGNMIDEDNLDIEDLDSILDDCLALGMPESHLQWHYRSRHESLIAFSNKEYYENSMLTFPSVNDREKRVKLATVNGTFNRKKGRINEEEGTAVVREILRRYNSESLRNQSVGIVTFNISQQGLIEDLLEEEYKKDEEFDKWAHEREENLFVKNLENVQGDERDVILFSVGFGPDEEGKLSLNFGPLNKEGGWKRLNVAVSRARSEMVVFSSMTPEMIDLNRTKAKGVEGLRAFLEFAGKGRLSGTGYHEKSDTHGITKKICEAIEGAGYKVQRDVGHSDFRIDIAVINPYDEDEYLLGIMLDGKSYIQSKNTKDREISQVSVLGSLGWTLHRVWTMDWWDNKEQEIENILELIKEQDEIAKKAAEQNNKDSGPESEDISNRTINREPSKREKKAKEDKDLNDSFDTYDRFTPITPHTQSKDELENVLQEEKREAEAAVIVKNAGVSYELVAYNDFEVAVEQLVPTNDFSSKENKADMARIITDIINTEAPISIDRVAQKVGKAFQVGRVTENFINVVDKAAKKLDFVANKQNGVRFYWRKDQSIETYPYYRVDAELPEKRQMSDICQQEIKNAVCITLQKTGAIAKDDLVRETVRTMGYGRTGATITEAIERGIKYGKKTGEIVVNEKKQLCIGG